MEAIPKLGFIGAGKLAESIARGVVQSGVLPPHRICTAIHVKSNLPRCLRFVVVEVLPNNEAVVEDSDAVIFSVKLQVVKGVVAQLKPFLSKKQLLVSVVAGVKLKDLQAYVGQLLMILRSLANDDWIGHNRFIRVMPNTPAAVGEAASVMSSGGATTREDGALISSLFGSVEKVWKAEEKSFDAITALSGSGPAYIFLAIEALSDGGVAAGLPRDLAYGLASQTVLGAATMVTKMGKHLGQLNDYCRSTRAGEGRISRYYNERGCRCHSAWPRTLVIKLKNTKRPDLARGIILQSEMEKNKE